MERTGWCWSANKGWLINTTPSARDKVAPRLLIDRASTPPQLRRGVVQSLQFRHVMKQLDRAHILTRIIEAKKTRLHVSKMRVPEAIVKRMAEAAKPVSSLRDALVKPASHARIIAEVKKASPSRGVLRETLDVVRLAETYTQAGACAISVVTEEDFFHGDLGWISMIRSATELPVLRKDFLWDPFQIYETRAAGAS